eukprot:COSAG03_NODE_3480_length_1988_cov_4.235574_1_plen_32_part_10
MLCHPDTRWPLPHFSKQIPLRSLVGRDVQCMD